MPFGRCRQLFPTIKKVHLEGWRYKGNFNYVAKTGHCKAILSDEAKMINSIRGTLYEHTSRGGVTMKIKGDNLHPVGEEEMRNFVTVVSCLGKDL